MLEKIEIVDLIEVIGNGCVQIRTKTAIKENGVEISSKFHRHVIVPGDNYNNESDRVKAICAVTHTPEIISAYQAAQEVAKAEV